MHAGTGRFPIARNVIAGAREIGDTMEQIAIRLPKALLEKLDDDVAGRLDGKNRSDLIRELIVEAYEACQRRGR